MRILAPAKINLTLTIKGRRDDGFHEIESLMVPVSIYDELEVERIAAPGVEFSCDEASLPLDDSNLVVRAANLFSAAFDHPLAVRIALRKNIPHGAGLGGGSSDAAATLLALREISGKQIPREALYSLAAQIGSDVPFFLERRAARVTGRGEIVTPCEFGPQLSLLLVKPPFGVPTPWAYGRWRDSVEIPGVPYARQQFEWGMLVNDLERSVFEKFLLLADLKMWLLAQPEIVGALMSGSGATVFAVLKAHGPAEDLIQRIRAEFGPDVWCRPCETVSATAGT